MVKISIDSEACCGTGYCARVAPEIFELVDEKATLRAGVTPGSVDPEKARWAERACPWRAIQVSDESEMATQSPP